MNLKNYTVIDIGLIKLAVFCGALFLVSVWPAFADWTLKTHWAWFLGAAIIIALKPVIKTWK